MALKSKFAKRSNTFKANKIFTDRTEPQTVFANCVADVTAATDEAHSRRIIVFYGKGGIGKTSLLKQIADSSAVAVYPKHPGYRFCNICINLEAYDYANPINILTSIRSMLHGDGSLFDYALMQYYAKARISMEAIKTKNAFLSPVIVEALNDAISICTASVSIPKTILEKSIDFIQDQHFRRKYKEEIQEISTLDEFEIFERLPYYLALCINHSAQKGVLHVLFLDSYEILTTRTQGMVSSVEHMAWLQELFLSCERTLFVIGSRDRLDWDKKDEDWQPYLDQHLLTNLSDEDCRWFLERVPISDESVIRPIICHAGGVPLYLDLCVDLYEDAVNNGRSPDFDHFSGSTTIIDRYMRHLKEKDQHAVSILSTLQSFDCTIASKLLEKMKLLYHLGDLSILLEKSVFLQLSGSNGLWKVDESIRNHIYEQMPVKWRIVLLEQLLDVILENRNGRLYGYFAMVLENVIRYPEHIPPVRDKLFEALEYFAGIGFWNELRFALMGQLNCDAPALHTLAVYAELLWLRRTGNLSEAERFDSAHPIEKAQMGVWHYMYRFLQIHISHLLGNYDTSILRYRELLDEMDLVKTLIPVHIYNTTAIKYADLLFLKGHFDESLAMTEQLLAAPDTPLPDMIELLRIKGHIFRFRRHYREAALIYSSALELVQENKLLALEGKLYTNLAESNCLMDPEAALSWYDKAMEKNISMNNEIECGKAQTAASVAMTASGQSAQGERLARTAIVTAEMTGYRSGKLFALLALAYAQRQNGDSTAKQTLEQARCLSDQLGVYRYLLPEQ